MCATVCPSQALAFVPIDQIKKERKLVPTNTFQFGKQTVTTKVYMMVPDSEDAISVDVVDYMWERSAENETTA